MREKWIINIVAFSIFPLILYFSIAIGYSLRIVPYEVLYPVLGVKLRDSVVSAPILSIFIFLIFIITSIFITLKYKNLKSVKLSMLGGLIVSIVEIFVLYSYMK